MFQDLDPEQRSLKLEETAEEVVYLLNHIYAGHKCPVTKQNLDVCVKLVRSSHPKQP